MIRSVIPLLIAFAIAPAFGRDQEAPTRPGAVVLDGPTLAKLREVAFDAAREGDVKTLAAYFEANQPVDIVNARGDSLLILAAYHGHDEAVRTILARKKVPIDAKNKMGFTALTGAAFKGYVGIARQLVEKGAAPDSANDRGQTPLMFAAMFGRLEVVKFLVESKVDVTKKDDQGRTALALAQAQGEGNAEVTKLLRDAESRKP